uniref:Uncharacterized protein n=1 Tax=Arion vulgaris TaxID=1028688 RepID=A0A0B7B854_9EUPU
MKCTAGSATSYKSCSNHGGTERVRVDMTPMFIYTTKFLDTSDEWKQILYSKAGQV